MRNAKRSVDIITWGFDPGMVLMRGGEAEEGERYGDILKKIAGREKHPVTVRIIVWHDDVLSQSKMKNIPGYYGAQYPAVGCYMKKEFYGPEHQDYNADWFADVRSGNAGSIEFHVRMVPNKYLKPALVGECEPPGYMVKASELYATHHQKMMLIDYEDPQSAIGYVMGHNSVTDFWDTEEHLFRDSRRERFFKSDAKKIMNEACNRAGSIAVTAGTAGSNGLPSFGYSDAELLQVSSAAQQYIDERSYVTKPYQDVSCRLRGPVLYDLNHNFCQAWAESAPPTSFFFEVIGVLLKPLLNRKTEASAKDNEGLKTRREISWKSFILDDGRHSVQLLRTQPLHGEKSIKECYANLTRQIHHYIFIQNQYIQYDTWSAYLVKCVERLRDNKFLKPIYVFILTSTPEDKGMDLPTYDTISKLGKSDSMVVEHKRAMENASKGKGKLPVSLETMKAYGINVVVGSLWTCRKMTAGVRLNPDEYEEIYIHAKVAIVDDAAFTIGSANLNLRSMAIDSELNVLSTASDVAYGLRRDLFYQCTKKYGPDCFGDMASTFFNWRAAMEDNKAAKKRGDQLASMLLPFFVDREPGEPVV
ncbi:phospholipase [Duganella sp. FT92W]|uniref:Phospholipase n=1 Tax=Pseudoduganella rivuli TaxID=2666085 RepID=A0A7X2IRC5_9BURK|nr:phospholipase [Pseudoduganella rivuli]